MEVTRPFSFELKRRVAASWSPVINCTGIENEQGNNWTISRSDRDYFKKLGFSVGEIELLSVGKRVSTGDGFKYWVENGELREVKHV